MGDLESLLLVVAAVYLIECAVWLRRGGVAVHGTGTQPGQWGLWQPGAVLGNGHGAIFLSNPLPPLGSVLPSYPLPISLSPQVIVSVGVTSLGLPPLPAPAVRGLPYEEAREISCQGRSLWINGTLFAKTASSGAARALAVWLKKLRALPEDRRAAAIRELVSETLDPEPVRKRWRDFQVASQWIRVLGNVLFFYLFLIAPALIWRFGFQRAGLGVAGGLLLQTFTIGRLFWRAHGRLFPGQSEERFTPFATMLLAPPTAIRASDLLGRRLLESHHPLAVAAVFCSPIEHKRLARQVLLDLQYPFPPDGPSTDARVLAALAWFRGVLREETEKVLARAGLDRTELLQPPTRVEPANRTYCPRCGAQFILAEGTCAECGGRRLQAFSS